MRVRVEAQQPFKLPPEPEVKKPASPRINVERVEPHPPADGAPAKPAAPAEPVGRKSLEEHMHPAAKAEDDPLKSFPKSEGILFFS